MWKAVTLTALIGALAIPAAAKSLQPHPGYSSPLHIGGRTASGTEGYGFQWPGIYFESRFSGTQVEILFNDETSNFNVILDDHLLMVVSKPGNKTVTVHANDGDHVIRVEKRSETQYATGHFLGFSIPEKNDALQPPHRDRQIEFIGDSLTVGYGNTSAFSQCTPEEIFETTDSQQGFGPLTAKHFNADYQINAFSGLGMVRNYDGREHPKYHMPMLYDRALFDDPTPVNQPDWHPQVIVIGIGSNDFSTPVRPDEPWGNEASLRADYVKTYTAFVKTLRARNPNAFILLTTVEGEPEGYMRGTDEVFTAMTQAGDTKIDRIKLPALEYTGCNSHPNIRSDAKVADIYIKYLTDHPQVWQGR